jgi:hypothetical protein
MVPAWMLFGAFLFGIVTYRYASYVLGKAHTKLRGASRSRHRTWDGGEAAPSTIRRVSSQKRPPLYPNQFREYGRAATYNETDSPTVPDIRAAIGRPRHLLRE